MSERQYIWVPKADAVPVPQLAAPRPIALDKLNHKPKRLWSMNYFFSEHIRPPANMPLVHRDTAILESEMHDWSVRGEHLFYRGIYNEGGCWIALEY